MAQVGVQYPDLSQMFGKASLMPTFMGMDRFKQAQQNEQQNLQTVMQQNQIAKDRAPMDLEQLMAQTAESKARVPYMQEQTNALRNQNEVDAGIPKEQRIKAKLSEIAAKMSDNDFKQMENSLNTQISNPNIDANVRQQLLQVRDLMPRMHEMRTKAKLDREQAESIANIQGGYSNENARIAASSRERVAETKSSATTKKAIDMYAAAAAGKLDPARAAVALAFAAEAEEDPAKKAELIRRSNEMEIMAQKLKPPPQPQIDPAQVPGAPLTTPQLPGPSVGTQQPKAAAAPDLKSAVEKSGWAYEPNKYDYRISPEGKVQRKAKGQ